jgi:hypothetical protein
LFRTYLQGGQAIRSICTKRGPMSKSFEGPHWKIGHMFARKTDCSLSNKGVSVSGVGMTSMEL